MTAPADYDADNLDLLVADDGLHNSVYLGKGDGTFTPTSQTNLPFPATAVDLNGDGKLDLLGIGGGGGVGIGLQVSLGNGDGTFGPPIVVAIGVSHVQILGLLDCLSNGCGIGIGDFNGDKLPDLAVPWSQWSGYDGGVAIFLNTIASGGTTDMGLGVASGSSGLATVSAGQTANYTLSIGGKGWSGQASLSCSGAPAGASCLVAPSSLTVNAINPSSVKVRVVTAPRTMSALKPNHKSPPPWVWAMAVMAILIVPGSLQGRFPGSKLIRRTPLLLLLMLCSCGAGGNSSGSSQHGTPAGTYNLTITATSGSLSQSLPLTLTVQ